MYEKTYNGHIIKVTADQVVKTGRWVIQIWIDGDLTEHKPVWNKKYFNTEEEAISYGIKAGKLIIDRKKPEMWQSEKVERFLKSHEDLYKIGFFERVFGVIAGIVVIGVFLGSWFYAIITYGWFLGLAFGWIPALIISFIVLALINLIDD